MKTLRTLVFPTPEIDLKEVLWYMRAGQDESAREVALRACALVRQAADCKALPEPPDGDYDELTGWMVDVVLARLRMFTSSMLTVS